MVRISGTFLKGKNVHEYTVPNNPDNNEWNNLCLEDIGIFWDLPNFDECRFYYFNVTQIGPDEQNPNSPVEADSVDDVINKYYGWRVTNDDLYKRMYQGFGAASAASIALTFLAFM